MNNYCATNRYSLYNSLNLLFDTLPVAGAAVDGTFLLRGTISLLPQWRST
jgi:hypothetical protein